MKTQALKGMRDLLPNEQTLRDYIQGKILETYRASGFERISTPMLEDMENLDKSDGGDNLNLIFKVLKRGDKLTAALNSGDPKELSDMGLRYDLTLPLSRFYAANKDKLPHPFKVIQTDRVFRAERPQKGRLREFVQCDIDILGDESPNAEVELIDVTTRALLGIGFDGFTVNINARRILRGSEEIHLTPIEFRLLAALLNNPGKVLTQRQLLNQVWGPNAVEHSHYLRIYMGHLRQKLEADPARPQHLLTETGIGYRFMP